MFHHIYEEIHMNLSKKKKSCGQNNKYKDVILYLSMCAIRFETLMASSH